MSTFCLQILAVFLIKPPPESDMDSMMPLVSPMNDVEFDEDSEEADDEDEELKDMSREQQQDPRS